MAILAQTSCIGGSSLLNHHWLPGDYRVIPVTKPVPSKLKWSRAEPELVRITRSQARSLVSNELPDVPFYYLTETLFYGNEGEAPILPKGVRAFFTADTNETAYVFSGRLGTAVKISRAPIVLSGDIPLKAVVPVCDAAI